MVFHHIRTVDSVSVKEMIDSLHPVKNITKIHESIASGGRSQNPIIFTWDKKFLIKTIDKDEKNLFQPKVYEIVKNDKISLLKFESVRGENFFLSLALTCMGLAFVAIAILTNKFRKY